MKAESPELIQFILREIRKYPRSIQERIDGILFPKTYDDFLLELPISDAETLEHEFSYCAAYLRHWHRDITTFLRLKKKFEIHLLSGKICDAETVFDEILERFGLSLWSIEAGLQLASEKGGIEEIRKVFTGVSDNTNDALAKILAQYSSQRLETNVSYAAYRDSVYELLDVPSEGESMHPNSAYLYFKLLSFKFRSFTERDLVSVLNLESSYSLVDRYLMFVSCATHLSVTNYEFISKPRLLQIIKPLTKRIQHNVLLNIATHLCPDDLAELPNQSNLIALCDEYTAGNYESALKKAIRLVGEDSTCFEAYEIICKASMHLHQSLPEIGTPESISRKVLDSMHIVLSRTPATYDALERLAKCAYQIRQMSFGAQLYAFVTSHDADGEQLPFAAFREVFATAPTARFSMGYEERQDAKTFLQNLGERYSESKSIAIFLQLFNDEEISGENHRLSEIPSTRISQFRADKLRLNEEFENALDAYTQIEREANENVLLTVKALEGKFDCLLSMGRLEECADLYLTKYFSGSEHLVSLSLQQLLDAYIKIGGEAYSPTINWPVAFSIFYRDGNETRNDRLLFKLQDAYLSSEGKSRPSQLEIEAEAEQYVKERLVHFLRFVCVPEILDSSIDYSSTDDLENERVLICQHLRVLDSYNDETYTTEIGQLTQGRAVREAIQQVDSSKVFVDLAGIRRSLDRGFHEAFERYREWSGLEEKLRLSLYHVDLSGKKVKRVADIVTVDGVFELFSSLFSELRDRYISSNEYGLDSYLSLRIRHGTFAGQVRRLFESRDLITTKQTATDKYHSNDFWVTKFNLLGSDVANAADQQFMKFSDQIDKVIDEVKTKWLQIRSKDNREGLFDFEYSESQLKSLYISVSQIDNAEEFVESLFAELKERAEANLSSVREALREKLLPQLTQLVDDLDANVTATLEGHRSPEFSAAIGNCRTEIQHEIGLIAGWFETVGETAIPDYDLAHAVNTGIEVLRRTSADPKIAVDFAQERKWSLRGNTFAPFVDLLHILLENAFKESVRCGGRVRVEVRESQGRAMVFIRNPISKETDTEVLKGLLPELNRRANASLTVGHTRIEGGSGYYKLGKLAIVDLKSLQLQTNAVLEEEAQQHESSFCVSVTLNAVATT